MKKIIILFAVIMTIVSILVAQTRPSSAKLRAKLIDECISYLGVPYAYGGLDKDGIDCSGLIYVTSHDSIKVQLPRKAQAICTKAAAVKDDEKQPGDLLFFRTDDDPLVCHVAVYTGNNCFIHCVSSGPKTGVIVSSFDENYWNRNYLSCGRILPVADSTEIEQELAKLKIHPNKLIPAQKVLAAEKTLPDNSPETETIIPEKESSVSETENTAENPLEVY
jgi:hypothetical protein